MSEDCETCDGSGVVKKHGSVETYKFECPDCGSGLSISHRGLKIRGLDTDE